MDEVKWHKEIDLKDPIMIAGWPGMGNVALGVVDYLRRKLGAVRFAELGVDPLHALDSVMVENGLAKMPPPPRHVFYYTKNPDMIIFEGESQLTGRAGITLLNKVLDVATRFKVSRIYTGAALPAAISYKDPPEVYGAVNMKHLTSLFNAFAIQPMDGGHISGLNGLLLGFAKERNIEALCLLATMPQYAVGIPSPRASEAIIALLSKMTRFTIEMRGMDDYIKDMDEKMALIEDKVKDILVGERDEKPPVVSQNPRPNERKKIPAHVVARLEQLFREAKLDRAKAIELKQELDRWGLYGQYEDRFLDLFRAT